MSSIAHMTNCKVEGEVMGSIHTACMCKLPVATKKNIDLSVRSGCLFQRFIVTQFEWEKLDKG